MTWWNSSWTKKKAITLTGGASGAQSAYQVKLTVTYDSDMKSDFSDLRFTNAAENALLDSWMESHTASTSAVIWVETNTPANNVDADIYMYYGNSGAASDWDGAATFLQYHGAASANYLDSLSVYPDDIIYETVARSNVGDPNIWYGLGKVLADNPSDGMITKINPLGSTYDKTYLTTYNNGSSSLNHQTDTFSGAYVDIRLEIHDASLHGFYNDVELFAALTTNLPNENLGLGSYRASGGGDQKWSFVRKYAANPPTYAFGSELPFIPTIIIM